VRLVLDTNAYSALMSGDQQLRQLLETADWVGMPSVVIGELWAGFLQGRRAEFNITVLDDFLRSGNVQTLTQGRAEAERYGALVKALRERGTPIPANDIWIAAAALASDARLLSRDIHFGKVPLLVVCSPPRVVAGAKQNMAICGAIG
jgi:predicted nucleic acid-binding protein